MKAHSSILKNVAIIILVIFCLMLQNRNTKLNETRIRELNTERKASQKLIRVKNRQIRRLRLLIDDENRLIDESVELFNQLQIEKREVETLYVEKVKEINTYDAKKLKKYFDEELN